MTTKTPHQIRAAIAQRLADAHANTPTPNRRGRDAKLAANFRPDARAEHLLQLRRDDRAAFDRMPVGVRLGLGHYEAARSAHERLQEPENA